jgi:putrescine transport system substrate-binding protein
MKDAVYDVVILPGPALARAAAGGELRKLDKTQIPNTRQIAAPVAAKLAAYDTVGAYSLAWGWSQTGLLYDANKAPRLLGRAPNSWADALNPAVGGRLAPCGIAFPDARDEMFIAAWRMLGIDPAKVRESEVKAAADLIVRARAVVRLPVSRDPLSAIAGGAVCLTFGAPAQALIASRRSREGGAGFDIRFAAPREGGPIAIDALAEPRGAPHPKEASALIDYLLRPALLADATLAAGLTSAEEALRLQNFAGLWPVGVYDPALAPVIEKEWARIRAPEKPAKPEAKTKGKPEGKPAAKVAKKPARAKR